MLDRYSIPLGHHAHRRIASIDQYVARPPREPSRRGDRYVSRLRWWRLLRPREIAERRVRRRVRTGRGLLGDQAPQTLYPARVGLPARRAWIPIISIVDETRGAIKHDWHPAEIIADDAGALSRALQSYNAIQHRKAAENQTGVERAVEEITVVKRAAVIRVVVLLECREAHKVAADGLSLRSEIGCERLRGRKRTTSLHQVPDRKQIPVAIALDSLEVEGLPGRKGDHRSATIVNTAVIPIIAVIRIVPVVPRVGDDLAGPREAREEIREAKLLMAA